MSNSRTTTSVYHRTKARRAAAQFPEATIGCAGREIPLPHPGEILREEFLAPMNLSVYALANAIHVPRSRVNGICRGEQGISANIALRLGRYFGVDPQWFLNMQSKYDLHAQAEKMAADLDTIAPRAAV